MYAHINLLTGVPRTFTYQVPEELIHLTHDGTFALVPFGKKKKWGIIQEVSTTHPSHLKTSQIKKIEQIYPTPPAYYAFLNMMASHHALDCIYFCKYLASLLSHTLKAHKTSSSCSFEEQPLPALNQEQNEALQFIQNHTHTAPLKPFLLHGVTGSGKTLVYAHLINHTFLKNKTSILLAPEVTLAQSLAHTLRKLLPHEIPIVQLHSACTFQEKNEALSLLAQQKNVLLIGVHIPIMLPLPNLGLCIIDEEHDPGYQEKHFPYIHTKDAALRSTHAHNIPLVLGSATPSIASLYYAKTGLYHLLRLTRRYHTTQATRFLSFPLEQKKDKDESLFGKEVKDLIQTTLDKNEQVLLFLNRRGTHCYAQCSACKTIIQCKACSCAYTIHHYHLLKCHHCLAEEPLSTRCEKCGAQSHTLIKKGIGTQHVYKIAQKYFPSARIAHIDLESVQDKKEWKITAQKMAAHEIDILIGTHAITKGYHFPHLTLAVALWADMHLHLPHYLAFEHTVQNLIQLAGRVGREELPGTIVLQTLHAHNLITFINEHTYDHFYEEELASRQILRYPPFCKCALLLIKNKKEEKAQKDAEYIAHFIKNNYQEIDVFGPAQNTLYKIKNTFHMIIFLKGKTYKILSFAAKNIFSLACSSSVSYIPNPVLSTF